MQKTVLVNTYFMIQRHFKIVSARKYQTKQAETLEISNQTLYICTLLECKEREEKIQIDKFDDDVATPPSSDDDSCPEHGDDDDVGRRLEVQTLVHTKTYLVHKTTGGRTALCPPSHMGDRPGGP